MKNCRTLFIPILITSLIASCSKPNCPENVTCTDYLRFNSVGYDSTELDTVKFIFFKGDNTFTNPLDTIVVIDTFLGNIFVGNTGTEAQWVWEHVYSTPDTCICINSELLQYESLVDTVSIPDIEVIMQSDNRIYKFSELTYKGNNEETLNGCDEKGNRTTVTCQRYLASYLVNGVTETFSGSSNPGNLYIKK